jgi:hypothetical protein
MAETRKLAAILVSDVVGYSRLAGTDEDRILARLRALRSDLIDPIIARPQLDGGAGRGLAWPLGHEANADQRVDAQTQAGCPAS